MDMGWRFELHSDLLQMSQKNPGKPGDCVPFFATPTPQGSKHWFNTSDHRPQTATDLAWVSEDLRPGGPGRAVACAAGGAVRLGGGLR